MSRLARRQAIFAVTAVLAAAGCNAEQDAITPDLAADTANLPATDIYLAPLSVSEYGVEVGAFRAVAATLGYDNQPSFLPGGAEFYFVSEGESGKTDIWRYDIEKDKTTRLYESSSVSEYSPKAAPAGYGVSYIQENEAADVTRVHHALATGGPGEAVIDFAPLGYYAWLDRGDTLAVYLRGEPPSLHLVDIADGRKRRLAENIGRALHPTPDGRGLYFTQANAEGGYRVMVFDRTDDALSPIVDLPEGVEDFAVLFSAGGALRGLFAGSGPILYFAAAGGDELEWKPAGDFSPRGVKKITRMALSDDGAWIAVVTDAE